MFQQTSDKPFIIEVGLSFPFIKRNRPSALTIANRIGVPISAFDEPDRYRAPAPLDPSDKLLNILRGIPVIGLQRQTGIGIGSVRRLGE